MNVLILGGTGSIGTAVTAELVQHGHSVIGLSRSTASDHKLLQLGATPHRGDLREPDQWAALVAEVDGLIQLATTFDTDMAQVDATAMRAVLPTPAFRAFVSSAPRSFVPTTATPAQRTSATRSLLASVPSP